MQGARERDREGEGRTSYMPSSLRRSSFDWRCSRPSAGFSAWRYGWIDLYCL